MSSYVVLARRYRPLGFSEVLGQEPVARTLVHAIEKGRVAHAYLFAGPRGIGKTSLARIFARALCCLAVEAPTPTPCGECELCRAVTRGEDLDVIEIDGASNRKIENIRDLRENALFTPARARFKIYIIDEVHMLTPEAFNALLKILEEPPSHVKFVFATTEPEKVPNTILSRCQRFDFRRIPTRTIAEHLARICEREQVEAPREVLLSLAQATAGGMRDAQSLLDQLILIGDGRVDGQDLESLLGRVSVRRMEEFCEAIAAGEAGRAIELFEQVFEVGVDPSEFLRQALEITRDLLVLLTCGADTDLLDLTPETQLSFGKIAKSWGLSRVQYALGLFSETLCSVKEVGEGRALVELALAKLAGFGSVRTLDEVLADLRSLPAGVTLALPPAPREAPAAPPERDPALFRDAGLPEGALEGEEQDHLTLGRVRELWPDVLAKINERSSAVGAFLAGARPSALSDQAVEIGFPPAARFHRTQLEDPDRLRIVEEELHQVVGRRLRVRTAAVEAAGAEEEDGEGEDDGEREARSVTRDELARIGQLPIVNTLKDLYQARLIHVERT